jgi:deoxyribonuclease I
MIRFVILLLILLPSYVFAQDWAGTKNTADDAIYTAEHRSTFYCGCSYTSHEDNDGSGSIDDLDTCGYDGGNNASSRAQRMEWEHIVPASLMPARLWACWAGPDGSRGRCERENPAAQAMIFDLHNLAPSIGQVNQFRSNDRYADLADDTSDFGACLIEDDRGLFEPPPCRRGDVARVWFYMHETHGVRIPDDEWDMFVEWSANDPISPWEAEREERIFAATGNRNPYVHGGGVDGAGSCEWERP